jgi:ABC-type branched-subunit amino acid transport system substrate-binding protein
LFASRNIKFAAVVAALVVGLLATACGGGEEVPGVSDDEVVLGTHTSLTGPIAVYSQIPNATKAYFDFINDSEGGVNGRKIKYLLEDDGYSPPKTVDLVRKLVEQDNIFALLNGLGTPTHLQVVDYLQEQGVPDLFVATGASEWVKDPAARPMVFGSLPSYVSEGTVLGQYIAENFAGQKLGLILQNDDFGEDGIDGIKRGVGDALEIVGEETFGVLDADLNAQVDRVKAAGADVIAIWATPRQFSTAIKHARLDLDWDVPFVLTTVSANVFSVALAGPEVLEGTVSVTSNRQAYETENPGVAKHLEIIREYAGMESASFLTIYGQWIGELMVEVLQRAGNDLTREGLVKAAESIKDFQCSVCLFPVAMSATDHDPVQGAFLTRAEGGRWVRFGGPITWEGTLPGSMSVADLKR